ncbi:hypothetical protein SAMN02745866_01972 [Alteromonadaceae bacterium Bs31]|nr:hypothetical protein SAMN02745866_01972 [Alteromonadaceae bacterium Bs31]
MKLPELFEGPTFSDGDIVSFSFDEVAVSLKVARLPSNSTKFNQVSTQSNFVESDLAGWQVLGATGFFDRDLVTQSWSYYRCDNHLKLAAVFFEVSVLRHSDEEADSLMSMNYHSFYNVWLEDFRELHGDFTPKVLEGSPSVGNDFLAQAIPHDDIDGLRVKLFINEGAPNPSTCGYFSLGRRYTLRINFHLSSVDYPDFDNPFDEEFYRELQEQLFDDFLANLSIEYTEEAKKTFRRLAGD